jgi:CBS domain-containing protein
MTIKDLMSRDVHTVRLGDHLDAAARVLWDRDCGAVPVVDGNGAVVGMITDRDICMAALTQGRPLGEIPVTVAMARTVRTARPDQDVAAALAAMTAQQVRRLPVVDARGVCIGMVSTADLVRHAAAQPKTLAPEGLVRALAAIAAPRAAAAPTKPGAAPAVVASTAAAGTAAAASASTAPKSVAAAADKGRAAGKAGKSKGRKD